MYTQSTLNRHLKNLTQKSSWVQEWVHDEKYSIWQKHLGERGLRLRKTDVVLLADQGAAILVIVSQTNISISAVHG